VKITGNVTEVDIRNYAADKDYVIPKMKGNNLPNEDQNIESFV